MLIQNLNISQLLLGCEHCRWDKDYLAGALIVFWENRENEAPLRASSSEANLWRNSERMQDVDALKEHNELDPDHPLLKRYQDAVRKHLEKMNQRLKLDSNESSKALKEKQKMNDAKTEEWESLKSEISRMAAELTRLEEDMRATRTRNQEKSSELNESKHLHAQIQADLKSLVEAEKATRLELYKIDLQIKEIADRARISDDMQIVKNAIKRAKVDLKGVQDEKTKQDEVLTRLADSGSRIKDDLEKVLDGRQRVGEELKTKSDQLVRVNAELQDLSSQKKRLIQQWNSTLVATKKQNEKVITMQTSLRDEERQLDVAQKQTANGRKSEKDKEKELIRLAEMEASLKKEVGALQTKIESSRTETAQTETDLSQSKKDLIGAQAKLKSTNDGKSHIQQQISAITNKLRLEQADLRSMEDAQLGDSHHSRGQEGSLGTARKQLRKLRDGNLNMEQDCAELDEELRKESMKWAAIDEQLKSISKTSDEYKLMVATKTREVEHLEVEVMKQGKVAEKKGIQLEQMRKRLGLEEKSVSKMSSLKPKSLPGLQPDEDPQTLTKAMQMAGTQLAELQSDWLKVQNHVIKLSEQNVQTETEISGLRDSVTSYEQKKIRVSEEIKQNEADIDSLKKLIKNLQSQTAKLNDLLQKKWGDKNNLIDEHTSMQTRFLEKLKDSELECVQLEEKLITIANERDRLNQRILEAESEVKAWDNKVKDAKSQKSSYDSQQAKGELEQARAGVHRLQLRHSQVLRQQEKIAKEMEKAIGKRELLLAKGEASSAVKARASSGQSATQNAIFIYKNRIKQAEKDLTTSDVEVEAARSELDGLQAGLENARMEIWSLNQKDDDADRTILEMEAQKFMNQNLLNAYSEKHQQRASQNSSRRSSSQSSEKEIELGLVRERKRQMDLKGITESLRQTMPAAEPALRRIEYLLQAY